MNIATAARFLADQWPVFACAANKRPVTEHGLKDATTDPATVAEMFRRPGAAMIGVPTGRASGFFAVDLDVKNGGAGLEWLEANRHRLPRTRTHRTQSGGLHLLFAMPAHRAIRNSASKIGPGVDVRGDGGYVVVPPSAGYSIADDAMPAEPPEWLLDLLDPPRPAEPPRAPARLRDDGRGSPYALAALSEECDAILTAGFGSQEHTLNAAALKMGALAAGGEIDAAYARESLISAGNGMASQPGREPWTPQEVQAKVERAFRDGMARPRNAPPREVRHVVRVEIVPPEPPPRDDAPDWAQAEPEPDLPPAPPPRPAQALWVDQDEWTPDTIPKRPWLAPGYLLRGAVSILSGQGAGGKSSLVVAWTVSAALGETIGEFAPVEPMVVVNYNVEDDLDEQRRRYSAALMASKRTPRDIAGRVIRCGPHDVGTLFERDHATGRVQATIAMGALERLLVDSGASALICDPLAELHNAEENDNTAMRAVVAAFRSMAKRLNIAVLVLHHDRKGNNTPGDMDRMRGASAVSGAVRVALTLSTMSQEEADKFGVPPEQRRRHFRIDGAKSNYAPTQDAEWWRLDGVEIPNGETVAACRPWTPPGTFDALSTEHCIAALKMLNAGIEGYPYAVARKTGEHWAGSVLVQFGCTETQANAFLTAWKAEGVIEEIDGKSPRRGHTRRAYSVNMAKVSEMGRGGKGGLGQ